MVLSLQPRHARDVIECSENCTALDGKHVGHTKREHVLISKAGLLERTEVSDPQGRYNGKVFWRTAFLDIHSCAELLSRTISSLGGHDFMRNFGGLENGTWFPNEAPIDIGDFSCRDFRGRCHASHVRLFMQKHTGRPHNLHLVTFYPTCVLG